jgi:hypothetical protein
MRDFPIRTPDFFRPLVRCSLTSGEWGTGTGAGVWGSLTSGHRVMRMTHDGKHTSGFSICGIAPCLLPSLISQDSHMHMDNDDVRP